MSGIQAWLTWVPLLQSLTRLKSSCWPGLKSHLKAQLSEYLLSVSLTWLLASFSSSRLLHKAFSFLLFVSWRTPTVPCYWSFSIRQVTTWQLTSIWVNKQRTKGEQDGNHSLFVTQSWRAIHQFYHILFVRRESLGRAHTHTQREGITQRHE